MTVPQFDRETPGNEVVSAYANNVAGKTFLITGPSESGVGAQTAIYLAAGKPKLLLLAGRNISKIQPVIDQIGKENPDVSVKFVELDLASLASVRKATETVKGMTKKLDALINNAGIMAVEKYSTSKDGIELQLAANHVGHFLLTALLLPELRAAGDGRVLNVSSFGYMSGGVRFDDPNFDGGRAYNPWTAYAQSKTANILFALALADRVKDVQAFALNPGMIFESKLMTNVSQDMFAEGHRIATEALQGATMPDIAPKTLATGASTSVYGAIAPELKAGHSGAFLNDCAVYETPLMAHATGKDNADKLWVLSEKLAGQKFEY